jgi:hypothetical protein
MSKRCPASVCGMQSHPLMQPGPLDDGPPVTSLEEMQSGANRQHIPEIAMQTAQRPPKTLDEAIARWMLENGPSAPPAAPADDVDPDGWATRLSESIDLMLANERRGRSGGRCRRRR